MRSTSNRSPGLSYMLAPAVSPLMQPDCVCGQCEQRQRPPSRPAAAIPQHRHFNDAILMDFMIIPDI